ncbi:MAG: MBL fold metallo-hydrolase [Hyphomicrobiales bacterium]|nr:MBL fold metallo-hydrolase [Hyphomicrobiales bacterium]
MSDQLRFTILGCGSSPGVPRIGGHWGDCDPDNPKNRRTRCSFAVERISANGKTTVIIDTGPDFRQQTLDANIERLDGVLYTHWHADHVHGIDDLRGFALMQRERINVYADQHTVDRLHGGFEYCFKSFNPAMYPPIISANIIEPLVPVIIEGEGGPINALPIPQIHGPINSLGFRFDCGKAADVCYSCDISGIAPEIEPHLENLNTWILDALQYKSHISHFSLSEALEWVAKLTPKRAILTHMHIPLDYEEVQKATPENVEPAYDGLSFTVDLG